MSYQGPVRNMEDKLIGKMVEIHLLNGKRFLGKVKYKDPDGITMYCIPVKVLETSPEGTDISGQLKDMLHTLFFPYSNIEYIDIGGEPLGFDRLFGSWFGRKPLDNFFDYKDVP